MNDHWLKTLYRWLLPPICVLCSREILKQKISSGALCAACYMELPWQQQACVRCASELIQDGICGHCLNHPPLYDSTIALFRYQSPIDHFILGLKFNKKLSYARLLGELMAEKMVLQPRPDAILPVPLHMGRLRERGYNQALEIARPVARKLRIPLLTQDCQRVRATVQQASMSAELRQRNIKNAFQIDSKLPYQHVAIIDDVVTTGSTASELTRVLRHAGVARVDVWCCAKTVLLNG